MAEHSDVSIDLNTDQINDWHSIITLVIFVITNIIVLFPFHIPIYVPRFVSNAFLDTLSALRIIPSRQDRYQQASSRAAGDDEQNGKAKSLVRLNFSVDFVTAPLIADLFLLAIGAIGRDEVYAGTIGANGISPIDIMAFFITLAYIAISIDASGLIRFLAFKVLQKAGEVGHRLFFYLYAFFFCLGSFIGNDPIILSGTAFLAYMTRVSSNIVHPRAWIHTQFAVANIASAILVSSNPTNLVLAGAFGIRFIDYTANMIVPVVFTAIFLFPFLLYIVFADESLIPQSIKMHELPEEARTRKPVNPNIPHARGNAQEEENKLANSEQGKLLSLEEIMNPFLDKGGATFGAVVMAATLVTLLAINAASTSTGEHPVFYVTLPAAFVMFCWDVAFGWYHRDETREIARKGREEVEQARAEKAIKEEEEARRAVLSLGGQDNMETQGPDLARDRNSDTHSQTQASAGGDEANDSLRLSVTDADDEITQPTNGASTRSHVLAHADSGYPLQPLKRRLDTMPSEKVDGKDQPPCEGEVEDLEKRHSREVVLQQGHGKSTLVSLAASRYRWSQETFPTVTAVLTHLPYALVPFAFTMFVLVQALVTKGWVAVFAYGWDHWVNKTGTIGSIGGMGFLSVILCNFAGTNIGTTILLSRVVQSWEQIHLNNGTDISDRTFWATVYSMAIGVNYGAFSTAFSASLAGLLWRDILARKHIRVRSLDFARVNLPIIAISTVVGCAVLVGEVYIYRGDQPYSRG